MKIIVYVIMFFAYGATHANEHASATDLAIDTIVTDLDSKTDGLAAFLNLCLRHEQELGKYAGDNPPVFVGMNQIKVEVHHEKTTVTGKCLFKAKNAN